MKLYSNTGTVLNNFTFTDTGNDLYVSVESFPSITAGNYVGNYYIDDGYIGTTLFRWSGDSITENELPTVELNAYCSIDFANQFFVNRLNTLVWDEATTDDKARALNMATQAIDKLNFMEEIEEIPDPLKQACCLCAIKFLDGWDLDEVRDEERTAFNAYGSVKQSYKDVTLPYLASGIPSAEAWDLILPYLVRGSSVKFDRVN